MKKIIMLSLCALFAFSPHLGASSTDEAIRGVTTFLKEGFNANKLFIFESKLRENEEFKTHFPETYSNLKFVSLEQLLLTDREALTQDFETDLKNLTQKLVEPLDRNKTTLGDNNYSSASEIIDYITKRISNKGESGAGTGTAGTAKGTANANANANAKSTANGTAKDAANGTAKSTANGTAKDAANGTAESLTNVTKLLRILKEVNRIEAPKNRSAKNRSEENGNKENGNKENGNEGNGNEGNGSEENASEENKIELITYIEELNEKIKKLTLGAMFFASLSDVHKNEFDTKDDDPDSNKNEEAIAEILSSYALPVVSFRQKAERGSHIFISAYASFGFEVDYYDDENANLADSVRERSRDLLYVPVGVEIGKNITLGVCDPEYTGNWFFDSVLFIIPCAGSMDIMLSPFDFAYPWQQQSDSAEESFTLDDIWAPSVAVSLSSRKYPVVLGHGFQQTRYDDARGTYNDRRFWFLGIEMPLYRLY